MLKSAPLLLALAAVPALCLSVAASAQDKEVWACQSVKRAGLKRLNNNWETKEFVNETLLLTIDGVSSSWKVATGDWPATCTENGPFLSCNETVGGVNKVVLMRDSGRAAFIDVYGGLLPPENEQGMMVGSYNCTKF